MISERSAGPVRGGVLMLLLAALSLTGCRGGGGSDPPPSAPPAPQSTTYRATLLEVEIVRSADGLAMPVSGLPVAGAELTR